MDAQVSRRAREMMNVSRWYGGVVMCKVSSFEARRGRVCARRVVGGSTNAPGRRWRGICQLIGEAMDGEVRMMRKWQMRTWMDCDGVVVIDW